MYPSVSACFVPVGGATTFKLKEFVPIGLHGFYNDMIQSLNPATTEANGQYIYVSLDECREFDPAGGYDMYAGWWLGGVGVTPADETEITVGQAFLGAISTGANVRFRSSGEAPTVNTKFTTDGGMYPFFGNYLPKTIKLKDIVPVGLHGFYNDMIQTLNPETTEANGQYIYVSLDECREFDPAGGYDMYAGWWLGGVGVERADETDIPAGTAFLGAIITTTEPVDFQFPSVLAD